MRPVRTRSAAGPWLGALLTLLWVAPAAAGAAPAKLTAAIGDVRGAEGRPLSATSDVAERERIVMGEDGKCSMLVDGNLILQLCEKTVVTLRTEPDGRRIVKLDAGRARVIAAPRLAQQRIEIHTPAAVATLLGTIVQVSVDLKTRDTIIASTHNQVKVRNTDERFPGETILKPFEQVTIPFHKPAAPKRRMARRELQEMERCAADLRLAALADDRDDVVERLATEDIPPDGIGGPPREPPPAAPTPWDPPGPGDDPNDLSEMCVGPECTGDLGGGRQGPFN